MAFHRAFARREVNTQRRRRIIRNERPAGSCLVLLTGGVARDHLHVVLSIRQQGRIYLHLESIQRGRLPVYRGVHQVCPVEWLQSDNSYDSSAQGPVWTLQQEGGWRAVPVPPGRIFYRRLGGYQESGCAKCDDEGNKKRPAQSRTSYAPRAGALSSDAFCQLTR